MGRASSLCLVVVLVACDSKSAPAPDGKAKSSSEAKGTEEMKRVKQDVEKANAAGLQRNDDAIDRAQSSEAVERGAPGR
jgi:hypothetical protein